MPLDELADPRRDGDVVRAEFLGEHGERGDHRLGVDLEIFQRVGVVCAHLVGFAHGVEC